MAGMAGIDLVIGATFLTDDRAAHLAAAETTVVKAMSHAPNHALAHLVLGGVQVFTNRVAQGIAEYQRALALDRTVLRLMISSSPVGCSTGRSPGFAPSNIFFT
jgi:Tfp pilus assembly protein PilF